MRRQALTVRPSPTPLRYQDDRRRRLPTDDGVAGFSPAELDITVQENTLLVTGKAQKEDEDGGGYLHRGLARRTFERRFSLADHMKVTGASLNNGLLSVDVVREVAETPKPRTIKIGTTFETVQPQVMEQKAA
jgi:molecular chaperone IbpA